MKEDDLVHAASETDGPPNGQLNAVQIEEIEELIEMHEQAAADALQIFASSGGDSVKYFGERSAKTASALRFLLQEREWKPISSVPNYTEVFMAYQGDGSVNSNSKYGIGQYSGSPENVDNPQILWNWGWAMPPTHWKAIPALEPALPQRQGDRPELPNDGDTRETNGPQL